VKNILLKGYTYSNGFGKAATKRYHPHSSIIYTYILLFCFKLVVKQLTFDIWIFQKWVCFNFGINVINLWWYNCKIYILSCPRSRDIHEAYRPNVRSCSCFSSIRIQHSIVETNILVFFIFLHDPSWSFCNCNGFGRF